MVEKLKKMPARRSANGSIGPSPTTKKTFQCKLDKGFVDWLEKYQVGLALTTYQAGLLMFVGWNGKAVSVSSHFLGHVMGLDIKDGQMALAVQDRIYIYGEDRRLAPVANPKDPDAYDNVFVCRNAHRTGKLFTHDVAFTDDGLWFANTRFSCLASLDDRYSFVPRWQPPFIKSLSPDDRCHLNGLAVKDGKVRSVTALGATDSPRGWREGKVGGGVVIDVPSGEIIATGLAMPHSPRWHNDQLWVLDSGHGRLLRIGAKGELDEVAVLPGYLRGLSFYGNYAVVGLCKIREKRVFGGMPLEAAGQELLCGVAIINIVTGERVGMLEFTQGVEEIYDIRVMPDQYRLPLFISPKENSSRDAISTPEASYWVNAPAQPRKHQILGRLPDTGVPPPE